MKILGLIKENVLLKRKVTKACEIIENLLDALSTVLIEEDVYSSLSEDARNEAWDFLEENEEKK